MQPLLAIHALGLLCELLTADQVFVFQRYLQMASLLQGLSRGLCCFLRCGGFVKKFIDHLSCFNFNESQYWVVPDVYRRGDFEVSWFRTAMGNPVWKVRARGENAEWVEFDNRDAVAKLSECGVDLLALRNCIAETVLRQAVYAAQISKSAKELLGDQNVDSAVAENELFVADLVSKIKDTLANTHTEQEKNDTPVRHLKLVTQPQKPLCGDTP